ncbi:MAG TPA: hypothetical protein VK147_11965 [Candidatus Didemnitutus sp.]|nr:hypothetical protein [Candidatus Didemnitutus sp.]
MNTRLLTICLFAACCYTADAQCLFIPSTSSEAEVLSYDFSGGSFEKYGCSQIDPTYWISGKGKSITFTFVEPTSYPSLRVWGMNTDDTASIRVNGESYILTASTGSYDKKVLCGTSPGTEGVQFVSGMLVGANSPSLGNYSYQDVQLKVERVSTITLTGLSGSGWGFAGVVVNCPVRTEGEQLKSDVDQVK